MEFVGDGWIGGIIGQYVRSRFPGQSEKFYHNLKQHIVSKDGLCRLSARLGFGEYALLSAAAEDLLTRKNPSLLEDMFEAFTCAVVEDLGIDVMQIMIKNIIESTIDFREAIINDSNYKDILKRICRENAWSLPDTWIWVAWAVNTALACEWFPKPLRLASAVAVDFRPKAKCAMFGQREWA